MSEYWNRSGEVSIEFNADEMKAVLHIDGKRILSRAIWSKLTPKELVKGLWQVEETSEVYQKKSKRGVHLVRKKNVIRNAYKEFTKLYGTSPSRVCKIYNATVYASAIAPYKDFSNLFYRGKRVSPDDFTKVVEQVELLSQVKKDRQRNILPLIMKTKMSPKELKVVLGKGVWKKLANNTFHRNQILCNYDNIPHVMEYDSTALKLAAKGWREAPEAYHWVKNVVGIPYTKYDEREATDKLVMFLDTKMMAQRINLPFNEKWSARKMEEKHNEYARLQQRMIEQRRIEQLAKSKAVDLSSFYKQTSWEKDGVTATILTTYDRITQEGVEMKHCVAGYAEHCINKEYAVVSLTDGTLRTTLGIYVTPGIGGTLRFSENQHYGKCNSNVEDERFISLAKDVVNGLNKMKLKKENNA